MDKIKEIVNVYCDESRVENHDSDKMVIGAILIPRQEKERIVHELKNICQKYNFIWEIKWTKTSNRYLDFYKSLIDYFMFEKAIQFRCIVVDKTKVDYLKYHQDDEEVAFFKFYYIMLKQKLLDYKKYYIFLDKKPIRDKNKARALHSYLESYILMHKHECSIEHLQAYPSHENIIIQLSDYLTGLVGYAVNKPIEGTIKFILTAYLRGKLHWEGFSNSSSCSEEKFNFFVWTGRE
jgi:hypothetical protein